MRLGKIATVVETLDAPLDVVDLLDAVGPDPVPDAHPPAAVGRAELLHELGTPSEGRELRRAGMEDHHRQHAVWGEVLATAAQRAELILLREVVEETVERDEHVAVAPR